VSTRKHASEDVLPRDVRRRLDEIGRADVVVGIPCFNNEATIGGVVTAVEAGLRTHFPDLRSVICASDGGSTDRTRDAAASAAPDMLVFVYAGIPGKGSAVRSVLEVARALGARACASVDADLRSITPTWVERLLAPIVRHRYGFVAPMYARHKYDGTITNSLAYPVTTALYGVRVRQPIGGEFGLSGGMVELLAAQRDVWETEVARFGIDIWMTTTALVEGIPLCQAMLGSKVHDPKDPADLAPMFRQVVGSLFVLAAQHADRWLRIDTVATPPTFGSEASSSVEPVEYPPARLREKFVDGLPHHRELWRRVLSKEPMEAVERTLEGLRLDIRSWITIVYDFLVAYGAGTERPDDLVEALIPLYFARTAAFVEEAARDDWWEGEARIEAAVDTAVEMKPYLVEQWRAAVPATP
jgi:glycosyltransferase involved in cell wall biosynthesis